MAPRLLLLGLSAALAACGSDDSEASEETSSGGSQSADPTGDPTSDDTTGSFCEVLNDEFDDPATLGCWTDYDASLYTRLDIGGTGLLTLEPTETDGWFGDGDGPFLYKMISGNFVIETHVAAVDRASPADAPSQAFNSAGFVLRDPASASGTENWLMYNLGFQDSFVGTEGKTTTNSTSMLTLNPGLNAGRLRVCRVGADFMMFKFLDDENSWTLEHTFPRADLPDALQVGMVANGFTAPPDLRAEFDYVRFGVPADMADCTADL